MPSGPQQFTTALSSQDIKTAAGGRQWDKRFAEPERARNVGPTLRRLAGYLLRDRALVALMALVVLVGVVCSVLAPSFQSEAVDVIAGSSDASLVRMVALMLAAYLGHSAGQLLQRVVSAHLSQRMVRRLRDDLFSSVVDLPVGYLDRHSHGDVMSRMTNDVDNVSGTISSSLPTLVSGALTIAGTLVAMLCYSWQLTLLSCSTVILTVAATKFLSKRVRANSRRRQAILGQLNGSVEETISGLRTVVAYNRQDSVCTDFNDLSDRLTRAGIRTDVYSGVMGPVMNCIRNLDFVVIAAFGGLFAVHGMVSVGVISAFIVYARQFSRPLNELAQVYGELQTAVAGAERVFDVMDQPAEDMSGEEIALGAASSSAPTVSPASAAGPAPACSAPVVATAPTADVSFQHVDFSYEPGKPVLRDFTLQVPAGKKVALVGATGSGKTTVVNLLERFYDPQQGTILLGGQDIARVSRASLRRNMAIVLQDTVLFSDTMRANLLYARPDATDADLWQSLELSRAADLVRALPRGLDTVLRNGGEELSQGQRQLLAIARAFVADPRVLILDEATSNVDTRTEAAVQDAMVRVMANRTSIVIAHRLSTVRDADLIVVLDCGMIVEKGTHDQLLAAGGTYSRLYQTQFSGMET